MTVESLARGAYGRPDTTLRDLRGIEYDLLARCTSALRACMEDGVGFPAVARAVDQNLRLWTVLAADVANPGNTLPTDLRARLFYLYEFTLHQSKAILDGSASPDALIEVNRSIMRGLRGGTSS